jgi:lysyl-tRNA synthetase class 2
MSEEDLIATRRAKLEALSGLGLEAWPRRFDPTDRVSALALRHHETTGAELEERREEVRAAGRILGIRAFGKAAFLVLSDGVATIQAYIKRDVVEVPGFDIYQLLDAGDWVGVEGRVFRTRSNELSIEARRLHYLAKALRPLPEKWHGLADVETRYRQRYIDLAVNPEVRRVFQARSAIVRETRAYLDGHGFVEVETPMMQAIPGGAAARPFVTHHNALDIDLYLRVAPELYLKRLIVGGFERVYELNRNFRNEGISIRHNPEFTMLEFYEAYADYQGAMDRVEELVATVALRAVGGGPRVYQGRPLDLGKRPYPRLRMREAVGEALARRPELGFDPARLDDEPGLAAFAARLQPEKAGAHDHLSWGRSLAMLFEELVEPTLWEPVFVHEFPVEVSPLAKRSPADPRMVERFELYAGGLEIANAFSELNDPDDQRRRFEEQAAAKAGGDEEAHPMDLDYVLALEQGMPPTAGVGVGIDRLTMLLCDQKSIRDVILFPLMRPR